MAFFKFRKRNDEPSTASTQSESIDVMRKRAKYRLIGVAVLVAIGVFGFPLLFDKQPRPIALDTPIEIPDKNKVLPLSVPAPAAQSTARLDQPAPVRAPAPDKEEITLVNPVNPVKPAHITPESVAKEKEDAKETKEMKAAKATEKLAEKPVTKQLARSDDGAKALALLQGREPEKKEEVAAERFVVQVGAFAESAGAHEVRLKVERAGLKTYTHVAQTKDGARIRVRVGPFGTRAEADKAAEKIKKLGLPAAILTL